MSKPRMPSRSGQEFMKAQSYYAQLRCQEGVECMCSDHMLPVPLGSLGAQYVAIADEKT